MIPDLIDATADYWKKLDELEAAYQRDEVSLPEVDARVKQFTDELGRSRQEALSAFWASLQHTVTQQRDTIAGVIGIAALSFVWLGLLQS